MSRVKVKAFVAALSNFDNNLSELKKYLQDNRLTQAEKKILEAWVQLGDNKLSQILETIPKLITDYDEVVEGQKHLIWGIALNNKGILHDAKSHVEASLPSLVKYDLKFHAFIAYYNLFILNYNLNDANGMADCLDHMKGNDTLSQKQDLLLKQCQFFYFSFTNQISKANKILDQIDKRRGEMTGVMTVAHLIAKFCYFIKLEKFETCKDILGELKNLKKFATGANYRFMNILLMNLKENAPIYAYARDFEEFPYLYHQIMVVKHLEENKPIEAQAFWHKLQINFPYLYADNFEYLGEKCLFSLAVLKHKKVDIKLTKPLSSNKESAVLQVLQSLKTPIDKEQLYLKVWGEVPLDKFEMGKMQRLISRLRDKGYDISFRKGCYQLIIQKKKVS